jgi:hypothetical protein
MARRISIICLPLLLLVQSCDKPRQETRNPPAATETTRQPRPLRPSSTGPEVTRAGLRISLDRTIASPVSTDRDQVLETFIEGSVELDPELAREAFDHLEPDGTVRQRMVGHLAMRLAELDLNNATQWAGTLETDEDRSLAFGNVALVLSSDDPEAAAKLLSDYGVASRDFDVAVVQVIQRWAMKSPAAAAAWVALFDPGEARAAGLKEVASAWADLDVPAAFAWISGIQDPAIHAEASDGMAEAILDRPDEDQAELLRSASKEIRLRHEQLKAKADDQ